MNNEQKEALKVLIEGEIAELRTLKNDEYNEKLVDLIQEKIKWWELTKEALEPSSSYYKEWR